MSKVDLFNSTYQNFEAEVLARIRAETFGHDFGQNSWTTVDEFGAFMEWLGITSGHHLLDVSSGSGGPAIYLANEWRCSVTGVDINESGVAAAQKKADAQKHHGSIRFQAGDCSKPLPFEDESFDAILCVDSIIHFPVRPVVLADWHRMLKPNGRILYTDPVVVTGPITNEEIALRSSIGYFVFVPPGVNERWLAEAGFTLIRTEDATENMAQVSRRWHESREKHRLDLLTIEGSERFEGLQAFFKTVDRLSTERRLSRFVWVAQT
jgi:ubiquinone/menaquinone biosynthesis C-methylase UbiE